MALMRYWFSSRQKRMRDALSGAVTMVLVDGEWREYTQSTPVDVTPTVWPDFVLVAEGDNLECASTSNPDSDVSQLESHGAAVVGV